MSVAWTITGEAGKALDATSRTPDAMGVEDLIVRFVSGGIGTMSWRIALPLADGTGILAPEIRQKVTLWRDGTRYFQGHCIRRRPVYDGDAWSMVIQVADIWWWFDQVPLTSVQTDQAGNNGTRQAFVFGSGSLTTSFSAWLTRAAALGVPVALPASSVLATTYDIPRITVTAASVAAAGLDLQRWVPDAMFQVDHSPAVPVINVLRRKAGLAAGSAATRTLTLGADGVESVDLQPKLELEVSRVVVDSAARDSQGRGLYQTLGSGAAVAGRTQIITVSGPESIDTTLPQDEFESVTVRSKLIKPSGVLTSELFEIYDPRIKASGATGLGIGPFTASTAGGGSYTLPSVPALVEKKDGGALPGGRTRFLTIGEPKSWWTRDGIGWETARAQATLYYRIYSPVPVPNGYSPNPPDWVEAIGMQHSNYLLAVTGGFQRVDVYYTTSSVLFPAVDTAWNVDTTLYRQEDYSFVIPPAGLAANLLAAQNFIPYEGDVVVSHEDLPAGNPVGTCINIANGPAELSAVRAMVQSAEMDVQNGIERLTCGASPRLAYEDLVRRFKRTGFDVFDFVSNPLNPS